jgi:hypothetical protein
VFAVCNLNGGVDIYEGSLSVRRSLSMKLASCTNAMKIMHSSFVQSHWLVTGGSDGKIIIRTVVGEIIQILSHPKGV